jgi:hypothetical protein
METSSYKDLPGHLGNFIMAFNELEIALGGALMRILRNGASRQRASQIPAARQGA